MFEIFLGLFLAISADGSSLFHASKTFENEAACVREMRDAVEVAQDKDYVIHFAGCESLVIEVPQPAVV